jgi:hypothetical protein
MRAAIAALFIVAATFASSIGASVAARADDEAIIAKVKST